MAKVVRFRTLTERLGDSAQPDRPADIEEARAKFLRNNAGPGAPYRDRLLNLAASYIRLSDGAFRQMYIRAQYADRETGENSFPSKETLAALTGKSVRQVHAYDAELAGRPDAGGAPRFQFQTTHRRRNQPSNVAMLNPADVARIVSELIGHNDPEVSNSRASGADEKCRIPALVKGEASPEVSNFSTPEIEKCEILHPGSAKSFTQPYLLNPKVEQAENQNLNRESEPSSSAASEFSKNENSQASRKRQPDLLDLPKVESVRGGVSDTEVTEGFAILKEAFSTLGKACNRNDGRDRLMRDIIRDEGLDALREIGEAIQKQLFLRGEGRQGWKLSPNQVLENPELRARIRDGNYADVWEVPISAAELRQQSKQRAKDHTHDAKMAGIMGITVEEYRNRRVAREKAGGPTVEGSPEFMSLAARVRLENDRWGADRSDHGRPPKPVPVLDSHGEPTPEFLRVFDKARLLFSAKTTRADSFAVWQRLTEEQRKLAEQALPHLRQEILDANQNDESRLLEARKFNPKTFDTWLADAGWEDYRLQLESGAAPVSNYKSPEKRAREARRAVLWAGVDVGGAPDHILKREAEIMAQNAHLYPGYEPAEEPDDLGMAEVFK